MRTGLLLESLGIPLAFPIIYPPSPPNPLPHPRSVPSQTPRPPPLYSPRSLRSVAAVPTGSTGLSNFPEGSQDQERTIICVCFTFIILYSPFSCNSKSHKCIWWHESYYFYTLFCIPHISRNQNTGSLYTFFKQITKLQINKIRYTNYLCNIIISIHFLNRLLNYKEIKLDISIIYIWCEQFRAISVIWLRFGKQSIFRFFRRVTTFHRICHSNYRKILQDNSRERRIFRVMLQSSPSTATAPSPTIGPEELCRLFPSGFEIPHFLNVRDFNLSRERLRNFSLIRPTISTPKFCAPCNLARIIFRRDTSDSSTKGRETFTREIRELYTRPN